jgi:nucleoid-associated protein YgaU
MNMNPMNPMNSMNPMGGVSGMMPQHDMGMMMQPQGVAPGMFGPQVPSGFVNLDPDFAPGLATLDVGYPCQALRPMDHHHHHHCPCPQPQPAPLPNPGPTTYVVKQGDTVWLIAQRFGTTMQAIILGNNLRNPDLIFPGQVLYIPGV